MPAQPQSQDSVEEKVATPQGDQTIVTKEQVSTEPAPAPPKEAEGKLVRVLWPTNEFVVEDQPVITSEGTRIPAGSVDEVTAMAERCGVKLEVED
jgi:hypothetical protein